MSNEPIDKTEKKQRKLDNLKPFKKGESGNPNGRPKGSVSITAAIKARLEEVYPGPENMADKKTYLEMIIDSITDNAIKSKDARTLKDIWAYIDGLPKGTMTIDVDKDNLQVLTEFFRETANGKKS